MDYITEDEFAKIKEEISVFLAHSLSEGYNVTVTICTQNSTDLGDECCENVGNYTTVEELEAALAEIKLVDRYNDDEDETYVFCEITEGLEKNAHQSFGSRNYIFDIFAEEDSLFNLEKYDQITKDAVSTGVNISFITDKYNINSVEAKLPAATNGTVIIPIHMFANDAYNHIFNEPLVEAEKFSAILATGYQVVELNGVLNAYNDIDTDEDTLTDWAEVDVEHWVEAGLITYNDDNTIKLPTVEQCMKHVEKSYVESAFARFYNMPTTEYIASISQKEVMPISSDPTVKDTDGDGYGDEQDLARMTPFVNPVMLIHGRDSNTLDTFGASTPVCFVNEKGVSIKYNSHFNDEKTTNKLDYIDVSTHMINSHCAQIQQIYDFVNK